MTINLLDGPERQEVIRFLRNNPEYIFSHTYRQLASHTLTVESSSTTTTDGAPIAGTYTVGKRTTTAEPQHQFTVTGENSIFTITPPASIVDQRAPRLAAFAEVADKQVAPAVEVNPFNLTLSGYALVLSAATQATLSVSRSAADIRNIQIRILGTGDPLPQDTTFKIYLIS